MTNVRRNLWAIIATVTALAAIIIVLVGCDRVGTLSQPTSTIPAEEKKETPEINTPEGDGSDQKVDPEVIKTLSPTSQDSGKKKPAKIPSIVQNVLDKLNRGVPPNSDDLLPVDDQGRILLEFHAADAVGDSDC